MAKFPDPTKEYQGQPVDESIDANLLDTEKFSPPGSKETPQEEAENQEGGSQAASTPKETIVKREGSEPDQNESEAPLNLQKEEPGGTPPPPPPDKPQLPMSPSPFRNIIPLVLGLLVFGGLVYAAVRFVLPRFTNKEPEPVTLTYWGLWEPQSIMQQVISDYERDNPHVTVNYTMQSPKSYRTRLQSAVSGGQSPDIARIHNTWLPMMQDDLSPLSEELVEEVSIGDYYPILQQDAVRGGNIYALPTMVDGLALFYNVDLLTQAGVTPPTDWNELRKLAFDLTVRNAETGIIERAGVAMGTTGNIDHWSDILGLLILQNSGDPGTPSSQEVEDALQFYTIFTTQDKVWDETQPNSIHAFATGTVAMIIAPSWQAVQIEAINPDLNFQTRPAPTLPGSDVAWGTYWMEVVPRSSVNQVEAWKFVKYLGENATLQKLYAAQSQLRGYGVPYPKKEMASLLLDDPIMGSFVRQAPQYSSWYMADRTQDEGINEQIIKYYEDAVNAVVGGRTPAAVTDTLSEGVAQVLSRYPNAN